MSSYGILVCDQGREEILATTRTENNWHSLQIHDLMTGMTRQFDLCHKCWSSVRIPELMVQTAEAIQ